MVFEIYDFDRDGYITPEDVRIILGFIPMLNLKNVKVRPQEGLYSGGFEDFSDRIKTQEEIAEMVEVCFGAKEKLNLDAFQKISESKSSDMLLVVLNILREKLPCSENFYNFQDEFARQMAEEGKAPE